ncbi:DNA polymerase III, delta [Nautilia profundicola AmH]|uniref:DNA polymerase III, delta n=1 Tax=Nautilia profundicola (strain ATCC BAA-1463 / DSM 18972 / AmH) TaxID=598659 RepID=B9L5L2_NAUPA|nr:DNA polymerase III subunit delta [Nautilia profundicola]ACM92880.1 DNA polymerase III, delta [Nautilia profundicola AmH]
MYKKDFDKLSKIPNYCVFFGNNFYLQQYENKIFEKFKDENVLKLYFDEYDFETAKTHLSESSLFGGKNVLIIKHNKIPTNIDKLIKHTKDSYLFFFYYGNKKPEMFGKNFVRFFEPNLRDILEIINSLANKYKIEISQEAKMHLATTTESVFIEKEIEKLSNYSNKISLDDIKNLVFEYKEESFEELFNLILNGKDFNGELEFFLETNDFKRIIPALIRFVRDLYMYNLYIKKTGASTLEGLLGYKLPIHINKQRVELAIKFKEKDYYELLKFLLNKELEMRNSDKNKESLFWETISYLKLFNSF